MIKIFGGQKSDHPLADLKEAKRLMTELSGTDAIKAVDEITHWLDSTRTEQTFRPDHRAAVVLLLDEAAQVPVRKLTREYLSSARLGKQREHQLWTVIHAFWKQNALAFAAAIEAYAIGLKGAEGLKGSIPMLAVRGLRAVAAQLKWLHVRYGPLDTTSWAILNRIYAVVETKNFSRSVVTPYPAVPGESTPEQEFLRAVMFDACSPDSLLPLEIELAERLIAHFAPLFTLSPQQTPDTAYWLDVAQTQGPSRIQRPPQHASIGLRFLGAGRAFAEIDRLTQAIRATREVPPDINLGGAYPADVVLHVLEHLHAHWSPQMPERKHPRHRVKSRLTVAWGFDGALDALEPEASLTFDGSDKESWIVENVSAGGFGALIPQVKGDWLKIGCLLALQPEGGDNWILGVIRRLTRPTLQQAQVGIQTLARNARAVELRIQTGNTVSLDTERGIILNPNQLEEEIQLLLRPGVYEPGQQLILEGTGEGTILLPVGPEERGADFEVLRCRQRVRDAA
jgi:hypothetical protein